MDMITFDKGSIRVTMILQMWINGDSLCNSQVLQRWAVKHPMNHISRKKQSSAMVKSKDNYWNVKHSLPLRFLFCDIT